ncbi:MAG TPA: hypothetical protein VF682_11040 [Pseudomonas sp.]
MATEYLQNGNFIDKLKHWAQGPKPFDPKFEPYGSGNSIYVPIHSILQQSFPELRAGLAMQVEFDACSVEDDVNDAYFIVSVGGITSEGVWQASPIPGSATSQWQSYSARIVFPLTLTQCFLLVAAPEPAVIKGKKTAAMAPELTSMRFANFWLFEQGVS